MLSAVFDGKGKQNFKSLQKWGSDFIAATGPPVHAGVDRAGWMTEYHTSSTAIAKNIYR